MATFFVLLPQTRISAEVEAPSSRKAETVYMDFLTRNKIVPWKERGKLKPFIQISRTEPGSKAADVQLVYLLKPFMPKTSIPSTTAALRMEETHTGGIASPTPSIKTLRSAPYLRRSAFNGYGQKE